MENRINIWFNNWFGSSTDIIKLIKKEDYNGRKPYVIVTNKNKYSPVQFEADEWYKEKTKCQSEKEYIDWCLKFCDDHKIEIFFPFEKIAMISKYKNIFTRKGITVIVESYDLFTIFNNKSYSYDMLKENYADYVPEYYEVRTLDKFNSISAELNKWIDKYGCFCFKLNEDVGGRSYHLVTKENPNSIIKTADEKISYDELKKIIKEYDFNKSLIFMPYLDGLEYSVDCLKTNLDENIILPRFKYDRMEQMIFDENIIKLCNQMLNEYNIQYPCNIQFRYDKEKLYFLEINMRMSGGTALSCVASDVNIPALLIKKELGILENKDVQAKQNCKYVSLVKSVVVYDQFKEFSKL